MKRVGRGALLMGYLINRRQFQRKPDKEIKRKTHSAFLLEEHFFFFEPTIAAERFPIWQVCSVLDQNQLIKSVSGNAHHCECSIVTPESGEKYPPPMFLREKKK